MEQDKRDIERILGKLSYKDIPLFSSGRSEPIPIEELNVVDENPAEGKNLPDPDKTMMYDSQKPTAFIGALFTKSCPPQEEGGQDVELSSTRCAEEFTAEPSTQSGGLPMLGSMRLSPRDTANIRKVRKMHRLKIVQLDEVGMLQHLLSNAYGSKVDITSIDQLETTRKQVKRVFFLKEPDPWLYQVWVFKADPKETAKEMAVYQIASSHGVPTGKPIGYAPDPSSGNYPYDIAVIGGVVEHAGNPYNELIRNLRLKPGRIHDTAVSIAKIIADSHVKLTLAGKEFERYGISLQQDIPSLELSQRLVPALGLSGQDAAGLIAAAENLYSRQSRSRVISHCDLHTGNIVTTELLQAISLSEFGMIDWGTVGFDNPYADVTDFWLHHQRQAINACGAYDTSIEDLLDAYDAQFALSAKKLGSGLKPSRKDAIIQSAIWNLYEMYDPVRKDQADIEQKARYHCKTLSADLHRLEQAGLGEDAARIRKETMALLKDKNYLTDCWT